MKLGLIKDDKLLEKIPLVDVKFTHSLCVGQTGSGKTTSFVYPNILERMKLNHGILFFDIKGSEHIAIKSLANESKRLGKWAKFTVLDPDSKKELNLIDNPFAIGNFVAESIDEYNLHRGQYDANNTLIGNGNNKYAGYDILFCRRQGNVSQ